jgi:predicted ArsR family transcriptional regulator
MKRIPLLEQPSLSTADEVARSLDLSERQLRRKIQRFVALGTLEA